jgi:Tol biopolymer transport system component
MSQLQWRDREGNDLGTFGEPRSYNGVRLSNDGRLVASSIGDPGDVWIHDLERGSSTRFTFDPGNDRIPTWSPDDDRILFYSNRVIEGQRFAPGHLFQKAASGLEPEEHLEVEEVGPTLHPSDWSPDGSVAVVTALRTGTGADIMVYSFDDGTLEPYVVTESDEQGARFSPDGRWVAYSSNESGDWEVYVQAFPRPGGKWQVSSGGKLPVWRADGKELFYIGSDGLMAVAVDTAGGFRHDTPVLLFDAAVNIAPDLYKWDVTPDGKRFLFMAPVEDAEAAGASVHLVQNWRESLE